MASTLRQSRHSWLHPWTSEEEKRVLCLQMAAIFTVITLLTIGFYNQRKLVELDRRENRERVVHGWDGLAWYAWLLAAPATLILIRRYPAVKGRAVRRMAALAAGSAGICLVVSNTRYLLRILPNLWLPPDLTRPVSWPNYLHTQVVLLPIDFLTYSGFFATSFAIDYYFKYRRRSEDVLRLELQAARLEAELRQAQLGILRGQLHPHFLFNAFNAVATLVRQRRNDRAVDMIARLGDLLRLTIENVDRQELTLGQEIDFVRRYLDVEQMRFGDKLVVDLEVDEGALGGLVPSFLLQPLVESAIRQGISRRAEPGRLRLGAERRADRLLLEVIDDGPGEAGTAGDDRAGLGRTDARLRHLYGDAFRFEIDRRPAGGTAVRLDLPWRPGGPELATA